MTTGAPYPPIADYGLIGDLHSCALVSKAGSIDWCCFPRYDSRAVFGRILDWANGGHFLIAPRALRSVRRRYLPGTNVLETTFECHGGVATLTDFMPIHAGGVLHEQRHDNESRRIIRLLDCVSGSVDIELECAPRFDYGEIISRATTAGASGFAHGGPDAIAISTTAPLQCDGAAFRFEGRLSAGERYTACVEYVSAVAHVAEGMYGGGLPGNDLRRELRDTMRFWEQWSSRCTYAGEYRDDVLRSALTLKALSYAPSGALIAAATTSLPETIGGERNWDYRYTWIRDATLTLYALSILGYHEEAHDFSHWIEWATLDRAADLQPMYGIGGERRLLEFELPNLEGYRKSAPVRIGNGAYTQLQLDIFGELLDSAHQYRKFGREIERQYWKFLGRVVEFVIDHWRDPDEGIWETRGGRRHFVLSKVMCWVALDRAIKCVRATGMEGDVDRWRSVRREIREDILTQGYDAERGAFVQSYGSKNLDAANLLLPLLGFISAGDPRMRATIEATERELTSPEGFVYRYRGFDDGLSGEEGTFPICTYWLADDLIRLGRTEEARRLFERCRSCANDLGLFSEEIDARTGEMLGNFPQAFSHLGLINTAVQLQRSGAAARAAK